MTAVKIFFWFQVFCDVISGVVLGLFGPLHLALGPTARSWYFAQVFIRNNAKIWVFWYFVWLASISSSKVM